MTVSKLTENDKKAFNVKNGALVQTVQEGMAAEEGGIKPYDIITGIDNEPVKDNDELIQMVSNHRPGDEINVTVVRDGKTKDLKVTLSSREDFSQSDESLYERKDNKDSSLYGKLGFSATPLTDRLRYRLRLNQDLNGVIVTRVDQMSEAYDNFIREGTVIVEINRKPITDPRVFEDEVGDLSAGDLVILKLYERGTYRIVTLEAQ